MREGWCRAAGEDHQCAALSFGEAAKDRRVEESRSGRKRHCKLSDRRWPDGRHLEHEEARTHSGGEAFLARADGSKSGWVGQHCDQSISLRGRLPGRGCGKRATLEERLYPLRRAVPDDELVAGLEEPSCDPRAHCADADDGDLQRGLLSSGSPDSSQPTTSAALRSGATTGSSTFTITPPSTANASRR
jgi:hypothetical protein